VIVAVPTEMLLAGVEAYDECRKQKLSRVELVVIVFLAMRAIEEMADMESGDTVH
jgi:hypothetical protein